jgi:hypothetical protein
MVGRRGRNQGSTEVIRFGKSWEAAIQGDKLPTDGRRMQQSMDSVQHENDGYELAEVE